jgi:hypothetical protein
VGNDRPAKADRENREPEGRSVRIKEHAYVSGVVCFADPLLAIGVAGARALSVCVAVAVAISDRGDRRGRGTKTCLGNRDIAGKADQRAGTDLASCGLEVFVQESKIRCAASTIVNPTPKNGRAGFEAHAKL